MARYGGEEFVVILPETTVQGASKLAESIRLYIENLKLEHAKNSASPYVTVSLGVATLIPERGTHCEQLISNADRLLYHAKENGRNQVSIK